MNHAAVLFAAGLLAGVMNALAGGGSFVTLPVLIAVGVPSVAANASSTFALYPGGLASAWVYRGGLTNVAGVPLRPAFLATLLGGLLGALLLLWTPGNLFDLVLPWLLLVATVTLAFGPRLGPLLRRRFRLGIAAILTVQFLLGVYGGYFGGAVGLMMIAAWSLLDNADVQTLSPARTLADGHRRQHGGGPVLHRGRRDPLARGLGGRAWGHRRRLWRGVAGKTASPRDGADLHPRRRRRDHPRILLPSIRLGTTALDFGRSVRALRGPPARHGREQPKCQTKGRTPCRRDGARSASILAPPTP